MHISTDKNMLVNRNLNQKYSPKSFKELIGKRIIAQALSNAIIKGKIAPFYLFHGPRGTGKTSAARIFGFALNCIDDHNAKPYGNCNGCSKRQNIIEMDATRSCVGIESMKVLPGLGGDKMLKNLHVYYGKRRTIYLNKLSQQLKRIWYKFRDMMNQNGL